MYLFIWSLLIYIYLYTNTYKTKFQFLCALGFRTTLSWNIKITVDFHYENLF